MDSNIPAVKNNLLLLQHQPIMASVVKPAVLPLGCQLSIANDSRQFFRKYHESLLNPFQIFGCSPFQGILMDLVNAGHKTLEVLSELHARFSNLPPVVGLCRANIGKQADYFLGEGFDKLIDFPGTENALQAQLRDLLKKNNKALGKPKAEPLNYQFDSLPVVNLKTYGLFKEFATLQDFPLDDLFHSFFQEMEGFILRLIKQYEEGNYKACQALTTSIRSLSGTLGASQMAQTSRNMEFCLKTGKPEETGDWLPYLIEQFMLLREYFEIQPSVLEETALLN
ncbi:MAG: Hpt domain-containing protein [Bacteroides sp.]|jgi:CheY-like chemotaxis protein|nr:Hpt domain-containing protein [Bacteroides sp.]